MWWPRRGNGGGSWLQEEKKANLWHRMGKVVAHGRIQPFPARFGSEKCTYQYNDLRDRKIFSP